MKILHLSFALLCGLSSFRDISAEEPEASCQDDLLYTYIDNGEIALTCGEIREVESTRQELCQIEEVQMHCPFSCGICCEDTENFFVNCEWIAVEDWRKTEYCGQTFEHRMVQEACPVACDYCFDNVIDVTPVPSQSISPSLSPLPTIYEEPEEPIVFYGIEEAVSVKQGIINLSWDIPQLRFDVFGEVMYHVSSASDYLFYRCVIENTHLAQFTVGIRRSWRVQLH